MNSKVLVKYTKRFSSELKRMSRKFPSLPSDLEKLRQDLIIIPRTGTPLGSNTYKIRLAIKSKGKGKSGGARIISYVETEIIGVLENNKVSLLTIYDKSVTASISKEEITYLVQNRD